MIDASPRDATVRYGRNDLGVTPLYIPKIATGSHRLTISKPGYFSEQVSTHVRADEVVTITLELVPTFKVWQQDAYTLNNPSQVARLFLLYTIGMTDKLTFGSLWAPSIYGKASVQAALNIYGEGLVEDLLPLGNYMRAQGPEDKSFNQLGKESAWQVRYIEENLAIVRCTLAEDFPGFVTIKEQNRWYVIRLLDSDEKVQFDELSKRKIEAGNARARNLAIELEAIMEGTSTTPSE